jgi:hypothetical protein
MREEEIEMNMRMLASLGLAMAALFTVNASGGDGLALLTDVEAQAYLAGQGDGDGDIDPVPVPTLDCFKGTDNCLNCLAGANVRCTIDAKTDECKLTEPPTTCEILPTHVQCGVVIKYPKPNCAGLPQATGTTCIASHCQ